MRTPEAIAKDTLETARIKANRNPLNTLILSFLGSAFVALGAMGAASGSFTLLLSEEALSTGKLYSGLLFSTGLMLVLLCGGELFTGNTTMTIGLLDRSLSPKQIVKNWLIVYGGNFSGALVVAWLVSASGLLSTGNHSLAVFFIKTASSKTALGFGSALALGILCNWLVCLAIWMSTAAEDVAGKVLGILFPIWVFVASGYEHSVANMFYIPLGMMAKANPSYVASALKYGISPKMIDGMNLSQMFVSNLIPVTIGNIIGGGLFVATLYGIVYLREKET